MQPSRRAFLFGRQRPRTPWEAFLQGLERGVQGRLRHDPKVPDIATLTPVHREDVRHARALCAEFGVRLQLMDVADDTATAHLEAEPGVFAPQRDPTKAAKVAMGPVLIVDPRQLNTCSGGTSGQLFAEPGCRLGDLAAAGLPQFQHAPPDRTLAAWLAFGRGLLPGGTAASGVVELDVLFSDGTTETLGPFGESDSRPLRSATVQRLIPFLFQLSVSADARACRAADIWPCRYRLDALQPAAPAEVNLAHLLLGHRGELAWIESVLLAPVESVPCDPADGAEPPTPAHRHPANASAPAEGAVADLSAMARRLQMQIKDAFDAREMFLGPSDRY
jgi:hypothetical protein